MSSDTEAALLDELPVEGLGELRAVEHFTVTDGGIVRPREAHDTADVRAARMAA